MHIGELQEAGLLLNEAKVYLALLDLGLATPTDVAKTAGIHRPNTYEALQSLMRKGLVTYTEKEKKKMYEAREPSALLTLLKNRVHRFEAVLPELQLKHELAQKEKSRAQVFEGLKAISITIDRFLDARAPILVYGIPDFAAERMRHFIESFHHKRIGLKINMRHIYNENAHERIQKLLALPYTEVRVLPPRFNSNVTTLICANQVVLVHWDDVPTIIVIDNEALAKSYAEYFALLWDAASQP